ncbi:MAG: VanW family protein, partial [Rubrobacter sp.]|nr:VanW family protein [Rubrobacter sp.]
EADLASGERGSVEVEPGRVGTEADLRELLDDIEAGIFEGKHRYEVPTSRIQPEFTSAEAEAAKPNTLIGEFETGYEVYEEPNRIENLKTASDAVDGTILAPGETFSFNAAAAPLSRYEPSGVIVDGSLDTALGGGLCQVASTLYMAANYAGLEIVERSPHYAELPYIRPGFDATVWFGSLDLKFRNNTGEYLLLEESVDEQTGEVVARVYGQPDDREVQMDSRKLSESGDTTRWQATRKVTQDGQVKESGPISTDTYQALQPDAPAPTGLGG